MAGFEVDFDVRGVDRLITDLGSRDGRMDASFRVGVRDKAKDFTVKWKRDARSKGHGYAKHYVAAIEPELTDEGLGAVIGPLSAHMQGNMNFEYGSPAVAGRQSGNWENPPYRGKRGWFGGPKVGQHVGQTKPHMSMNITADTEFPAFVARMEKVVDRVWR